MNLQDKIELVKNDILTRFPDCYHTVKILLWDDGTDLVQCRHGNKDGIHTSTFYNNNLTHEQHLPLSNKILESDSGKEFYVMTPDEYQSHMKPN